MNSTSSSSSELVAVAREFAAGRCPLAYCADVPSLRASSLTLLVEARDFLPRAKPKGSPARSACLSVGLQPWCAAVPVPVPPLSLAPSVFRLPQSTQGAINDRCNFMKTNAPRTSGRHNFSLPSPRICALSSLSSSPANGRSAFSLLRCLRASLLRKKWDTVQRNRARNSLKTNESGPRKVGHFFTGLSVEEFLQTTDNRSPTLQRSVMAKPMETGK